MSYVIKLYALFEMNVSKSMFDLEQSYYVM
jgi:hypothetical protein